MSERTNDVSGSAEGVDSTHRNYIPETDMTTYVRRVPGPEELPQGFGASWLSTHESPASTSERVTSIPRLPQESVAPQNPEESASPHLTQEPAISSGWVLPGAAPAPVPTQAPAVMRHDRPQDESAARRTGPRENQPPVAAAASPVGTAFLPLPSSTVPPVGGTPTRAAGRRGRRRGPGWLALGLAMLLTAGISIGGTAAALHFLPRETHPHNAVDMQASGQRGHRVLPVQSASGTPDWQAVAAAVSPAVVTINVTSETVGDIGSGVIYDAEGRIVTNDHVISSAVSSDAKLSVTLADGRIFDASIVGTDPSTDLAVIALSEPPNDLTVANFGSSSDLAVGQEVMAIGSPLGLSNTATTGIISALDRPVEVAQRETKRGQNGVNPSDPFGQLPKENESEGEQQVLPADSVITNAIQVDASINPGNSGGPLFDASGAVIGINSSIVSRAPTAESVGSIGLGFAIPSDLVISVAGQIITNGRVDHALLGVQIRTASVEVDGARRAGAAIEELTPQGAAEEAGLAVGDVILAVDGREVASSKALSGYIRQYPGGAKVAITYVRDGQKKDVEVTLKSKK